jgi:hypothetical protein
MAARRPRFNLELAKKATQFQISTSCARKANELLLFASDFDVRAYIKALFKGLAAADFAHVERMRGQTGATIYGDVYGKQNELGLWFVKLSYDGRSGTLIMSCHEAEHDIELADGRTLRRRRT